MRVLIIVNPKAGGSRGREAADRATQAIEILGHSVETAETERAGHAPEIVAARGADFDIVLGVGGDGTLNELCRGLQDDTPPLGIIPLGTANVLALEIGLPMKDPARAAAQLVKAAAAKSFREMPLFSADFGDESFPVIVNAGAGFDARVVHRVSARRRERAAQGKLRFSKNSYLPEGLRELRGWRAPRLEVSLDGEVLEAEFSAAVACRTKNYGGVMSLTPSADLFGDKLAVCLRRGAGRIPVLRHLMSAKRSREDRSPAVIYRQVRSIEIRSLDDSEALQIDGDDVGQLPVRIAPSGREVSLIVPID